MRYPVRLALLATFCLISSLQGCSRETPEKFIASGKSYLEKRDVRAAIIQFKNAVEKAPDSPEARYLLGIALEEADDPASAEIELRKALKAGYAPERVYPALIRTLLEQRQFEKALAEVSMQTHGDLTNAELVALGGYAQLGLGNVQEARSAFSAALTAEPNNEAATLGMARLAISERNLPRARELVDEVLRRTPSSREALLLSGDLFLVEKHDKEAMQAYEKAIELRPYSTRVYLNLVPLLLRAGDVNGARARVDALKKLAPRSVVTLYLDAQVAYQQGDRLRAREAIDAVLKAVPNHVPAMLLAATIAHDSGNYVQAEDYLRKVIAANPNQAFPRRLLVTTYLRTGQTDRARETLEALLLLAPDDPAILTLAGEVALASRDNTKAAQYYQKALALDPGNALLRSRLGQVHMAAGDTQQAIQDLEAASAADAGGYRADVALIVVHLKQKEMGKAQALADRLIKKQPDNPLAYNVLGMVRLAQEDQAGARSNFERALQIRPTYFPAARNLAVLDMRDGHPEVAKQRYEAILAKDEKHEQSLLALVELLDLTRAPASDIEKAIDRAIAANPGSPRPRILKVTYWLQHDDPKRALTTAQQAQSALPQNLQVLEALARAQMAAGEHDQAIASFGKLASALPKSSTALLAQAQAYASAKDWPGARQAVKKAIELEPDSIAAHLSLVRVEIESEHFEEARNEARAIQKRWPTQPAGYLGEAEVLTAQKAWGDAERFLRGAIEKTNDPTLVSRLYALLNRQGRSQEADAFATAWVGKNPKDISVASFAGGISLQRKDYAAAARWYKMALKAQPKNAAILNNLAWVLGQQHDPGALEYGDQALALAPDAPAVLDTVGWLYVEAGNVPKGLELLKKAHDLAPKAASIQLNLAKALIKAGQGKAAREHLEMLGRLPPGSPIRTDAEKLLSSL